MSTGFPEQFLYLKPYADAYGWLGLTHWKEEFFAHLSQEDNDALNRAWTEINHRNDQKALANWLVHSSWEERDDESPREAYRRKREEGNLDTFLLVMSEASRRGVIPLPPLEDVADKAEYDWSSLPEGTEYIIPYVEQYDGVNGYTYDFSDHEVAQLAKLADHLLKSGDGDRLQEWLGKDMCNAAGACNMFFGVLDSLGLKFSA